MPGRFGLKHLPAHLQRYAATVVADPPADGTCMACWREFNTIEDASDHTERPCHALRLKPCGHLIGSHCFDELLRRGFQTCPLCTQKIDRFPAPVPRWITFLLQHDDFEYLPSWWLRFARGRAKNRGEEALHQFDNLQAHLFYGTLDAVGGLALWLDYMAWPFLCTLWKVAAVFFMNSFMKLIESRLEKLPATWIFPNYLTSIMGADVGNVVPGVNAGVFLCLAILWRGLDRKGRNEALWVGHTLLALAVRNLNRLIYLKTIMLLSIGNFFVFGVMVAILIGMGVINKKY